MTAADFCWPLARLGEGIEALARHARLAPTHAPAAAAGDAALQLPAAVLQDGGHDLNRWIEWACARLGLESEAVDASVPDFAALLHAAGPAVLHLFVGGAACFVLLLGRRGGTLRLVGTDGRVQRCPLAVLRDAVCAPFEAPLQAGIDRLLADADVAPRRRPQVRSLLLGEALARQRVPGCWLLRHAPATGFRAQLAHARLPRRAGAMLALFAGVYALEIAGWRLIGEAALDGRLDTGRLAAWVLLLFSLLPLRLLGGWLDTTFALDAGRLLKQRLLAGALRLKLDDVRQLGAGQLLGRVMESQALEGLALNGGLSTLVAVLELGFAGWILHAGAAGGLHLALLGGWLAVTLALAARYAAVLRRWTLLRLDMTNEGVEHMVGHRTRLAQDRPVRRDAEDDARLHAYLQTSAEMDRAFAPVVALAPGGWIFLALAALAPAFAAGTATPAALAISLGGILFAHRALGGITGGLGSLARAALAWKHVAPLFAAGSERATAGPFIPTAPASARPGRLVDASRLVFSHGRRGGGGGGGGSDRVLRGVDLHIARGDRILLEGASGGGKSTLAALLTGLRQPDSGLLLLDGLDRHTLGDGWHRLATEAPQFHENHVLTGSLGFNLLMGRHGPATDADLAEARTLCEELGLGDLLARMPAGLEQMVGETGWQLSHGERSRLFLARALLQRAPLTVLDESFAALDPHTLQQCLACVLRRTQALVVIAHP